MTLRHLALIAAGPVLWAGAAGRVPGDAQPLAVEPATISVAVPGTASAIELAPVTMPDGSVVYFATTETTWDVYDVFVYALDQPDPSKPADADAVTRPSKPYIPPDRGFGHAGYAAISVSYHGSAEFCRWLSRATSREFRLPTEAEWEHACRAGSAGTYGFGDDAALLGDYAWFRDNAEFQTHPVATKKASSLGLHDLHGNAAEWCAGADGKPVLRGGSYRDDAAGVACSARMTPVPAWQMSDPQMPKSRWWLSDAPFAGFRVVMVPPAGAPAEAPADESSSK